MCGVPGESKLVRYFIIPANQIISVCADHLHSSRPPEQNAKHDRERFASENPLHNGNQQEGKQGHSINQRSVPITPASPPVEPTKCNGPQHSHSESQWSKRLPGVLFPYEIDTPKSKRHAWGENKQPTRRTEQESCGALPEWRLPYVRRAGFL